MNFELWFEELGWDEEHRQILSMAWNAALEAASQHVEMHEATDFNLKSDLEA